MVRKIASFSDRSTNYPKGRPPEGHAMIFENLWDYLLSGIVIWLFVDEFVLKSAGKHSMQAVAEQIVKDDIRPV
jgi:hypothetical protein